MLYRNIYAYFTFFTLLCHTGNHGIRCRRSTTTLYFLKNDKIIDGVDLLGWGSSSVIEILEMLKKRNKSVYIDKNCPEEIILRKGFIQKHFDTHFDTDSYILSWFTFTILIFLIPLILIVMLLML